MAGGGSPCEGNLFHHAAPSFLQFSQAESFFSGASQGAVFFSDLAARVGSFVESLLSREAASLDLQGRGEGGN